MAQWLAHGRRFESSCRRANWNSRPYHLKMDAGYDSDQPPNLVYSSDEEQGPDLKNQNPEWLDKFQDLLRIRIMAPFLFASTHESDAWIPRMLTVGLLKKEWLGNNEAASHQLSKTIDLMDDVTKSVINVMGTKFSQTLAQKLLLSVTGKPAIKELLPIISENKLISNLRSRLTVYPKDRDMNKVTVALLYACHQYSTLLTESCGSDVVQEFEKKLHDEDKAIVNLKEKGNNEYKNEEYVKSVGFYSAALTISRFNYVLYANRAQAYLKIPNNDWLALLDAKRSMVLNKKYIKAIQRYVMAWQNLGYRECALAALYKASELVMSETERSMTDNWITKLQRELGQQDMTMSKRLEPLTQGIYKNHSTCKENSTSNDTNESRGSTLIDLTNPARLETCRLHPNGIKLPTKSARENGQEIKTEVKKHSDLTPKASKKKHSDGKDSSLPTKKDVSNEKLQPKSINESSSSTEKVVSKEKQQPNKNSVEPKISPTKKILRDLRSKAADGTQLFLSNEFTKAAHQYRECVSMIADLSKKGNDSYGDLDQAALYYALGAALLETDTKLSISLAVKTYQAAMCILSPLKLPVIHLGLGKALYFQARFEASIQILLTGLEGFNKQRSLCWPGTSDKIPVTAKQALKSELMLWLESSRHPPPPIARCFQGTKHTQSSIYAQDPDFKGFWRVGCYMDCKVDFHVECWKKKICDNVKELLNTPCFTPDCPSTIKYIWLHDQDCKIKKKHESHKPEENHNKPVPRVIKRNSKCARKLALVEQYKQNIKLTKKAIQEVKMGERGNAEVTEQTELQETPNINVSEDRRISDEAVKFATVLKKHVSPLDNVTYANAKRRRPKRTMTLGEFVCAPEDPEEDPDYYWDAMMMFSGSPPPPSSAMGIDDFDIPSTPKTWRYPALDPDNPFSVPVHLRPSLEMFEQNHNETPFMNVDPTPDHVSNNTPDQTPDLNSIKEFLHSFFHDILDKHGPLKMDDAIIRRQYDDLPPDALDLIEKSGGLGAFLSQSIQFSLVDDIVCLSHDEPKARAIAQESTKLAVEKYRQELAQTIINNGGKSRKRKNKKRNGTSSIDFSEVTRNLESKDDDSISELSYHGSETSSQSALSMKGSNFSLVTDYIGQTVSRDENIRKPELSGLQKDTFDGAAAYHSSPVCKINNEIVNSDENYNAMIDYISDDETSGVKASAVHIRNEALSLLCDQNTVYIDKKPDIYKEPLDVLTTSVLPMKKPSSKRRNRSKRGATKKHVDNDDGDGDDDVNDKANTNVQECEKDQDVPEVLSCPVENVPSDYLHKSTPFMPSAFESSLNFGEPVQSLSFSNGTTVPNSSNAMQSQTAMQRTPFLPPGFAAVSGLPVSAQFSTNAMPFIPRFDINETPSSSLPGSMRRPNHPSLASFTPKIHYLTKPPGIDRATNTESDSTSFDWNKFEVLMKQLENEKRMLSESLAKERRERVELAREQSEQMEQLVSQLERHSNATVEVKERLRQEQEAHRAETDRLRGQIASLQQSLATAHVQQEQLLKSNNEETNNMTAVLEKQRDEYYQTVKSLSEKYGLDMMRAEKAETELLRIKLEVMVGELDSNISEAKKSIGYYGQILENFKEQGQRAPPELMSVYKTWMTYYQQVAEAQQQIETAVSDQMRRIKGGEPLYTLPPLQKPNIPPRPFSIATNGHATKSPVNSPSATPVKQKPAPIGSKLATHSKPPHKAKNSFDAIMKKLSAMFPNYRDVDIKLFIMQLRQSRGATLSGLTLQAIVDRVAEMIVQNKHKALNQNAVLSVAPPSATPWSQPMTQHRPSGLEEEIFEEEDDPCVICYEELDHMQHITTNCGHRFHDNCIRRWLREQRSCPTCRKHVLMQDDFPMLS